MSILNQACSSDCTDEDCPGIHPYTGGDWPLYVVCALIVVGGIVMQILDSTGVL
jgi:hypothetical protein